MIVLLLAVLVSAAPAPVAGTGFVRLVNDGGVWWLTDGPDQRFLSLGVDCVEGCYGHYEKEPLPEARRKRAVSRLTAWGFNTAAAWSSPSVWGSLLVADQIYPGFDHEKQDAFDAAFYAGWFRGQVEAEVKAFKGRREVIGYFLDNEVKWHAKPIFETYLGLSRTAAGSVALVAFLREAYGGTIADLNREWKTTFKTFGDVAGTKPPTTTTKRMQREVLNPWRARVAAEHYRRYAAIVRELDPDHLILGVRWAGLPDLELYKACSVHFDADSVNDYNRYGNVSAKYDEYFAATGKPIMITEWSFGGWPATPGGQSLQFVNVYSQEARAAGYRKFTLGLAAKPWMIGSHWFLYSDYDGADVRKRNVPDDSNLGLTDENGTTVYEVLAAECARTNREAATVHRASAPSGTKYTWSAMVAYDVARRSPKIDGDLGDWKGSASLLLECDATLDGKPRPPVVVRLARDAKFLYVFAEITDASQEDAGQDWEWEGDYLALYAGPADPTDADEPESASVQLSPRGGGADRSQPLAWDWGRNHAAWTAARTDVPGGYRIEARVPLTHFPASGKDATTRDWRFTVTYQDTGGIASWSRVAQGRFAK